MYNKRSVFVKINILLLTIFYYIIHLKIARKFSIFFKLENGYGIDTKKGYKYRK